MSEGGPECGLAVVDHRRLGGLLRDLAAGMRQEMFFLGKDVVHSSGNLLLGYGMEKVPGGRVGGTSQYRMRWEGGWVRMHGSYAGWMPDGGGEGIFYDRPAGRWVYWDGEGMREGEGVEGMRGIDKVSSEVWEMVRRWVRWWLAWEKRVVAEYGMRYRTNCYRHFRKLPKSRAWLEPVSGIRWLEGLEEDWRRAERAKRFRCPEMRKG